MVHSSTSTTKNKNGNADKLCFHNDIYVDAFKLLGLKKN